MTTSRDRQRVRITKAYVDALKPPAKDQSFTRDAELRGFGVRITRKGDIAFIIEKRLDGKPQRRVIGNYPAMTVEAARKKAQSILGRVAEGHNPFAEEKARELRGTTLAEAFDDFKRVRGKNLAPRTLYNYARFLARVFNDWRERPLIDISKEMVARRHQKVGETSGAAYANHAFRFLRALFNFAIAQYETPTGEPLLRDNPVDRLKRTRAWFRDKRRRTFIKPHQLAVWYIAVEQLKAADQPIRNGQPLDLNQPNAVVADLLLLIAFTGLRRTEALTLRWDQVDLLDRTLFLPDPKNHQPLTLPLPDVVMGWLEARHAQRWNAYVFPGVGTRGHLIEPKRQVDKVKQAAGFDFRLHDLRRTFATTAKSLDISVYGIKQLINHTLSDEITASYIGSTVEHLRDPMQRIAERLAQQMGLGPDNVVALAAADQVAAQRAAG